MPKIALLTEYEIHQDKEKEFEEALKIHAVRCLANEPGTIRFDVLRPVFENGTPVPNRMLANKLFANLDALIAHRSTDYYVDVIAQFRKLVINRWPILCEVSD